MSRGDCSSAFTLRKLAEPPYARPPRALRDFLQDSLTRRALLATYHAANPQTQPLYHISRTPETTGTHESCTSRVASASPSNTPCAKTASSHRHAHEKRVLGRKHDANGRRPIAEEIRSKPAGSRYATCACFSGARYPGVMHTQCVWDGRGRKGDAGCASLRHAKLLSRC